MVTPLSLSQAKKLTRGTTLYLIGNYNADGTAMRCRVTGQVKLWKRDPGRFQVPVKRGLYEYGYVTENNMQLFSLTEPAAIQKSSAKRSIKSRA